MAWEQDYHMQDPGRLALFDEYLEMSKFLVDILHFDRLWFYSPAVWIRYAVCGGIPISSIVRTSQQCSGDTLGCI